MIRAAALAALLLAAPVSAAERSLLPGESEISFTIKQMGVSLEGEFRRFRGWLVLDPGAPEQARTRIEVEVASLATGIPDADREGLKRPWLFATEFPKATFTGSGLKPLWGDRYDASGTLAIRGRSQPLSVPVRLALRDDGVAVVSGDLTIRRTAFGIGGGEWNDDDLVSDEVTVRFRLAFAPPRTGGTP